MGNGALNLAFIGNLGPSELILIFVIIFFVFGADKMPKIARDLGKGIKEFKKSLSGDNNDKKDGSGT